MQDGCYRDVYIPKDSYQKLREVTAKRERLPERLNGTHNRHKDLTLEKGVKLRT